MNERNLISEAARLFGVAASALRYWEEQGLVQFERNRENQYRLLSHQTILDLCEILLYRSASIPVKEIREMASMSPQEMNTVLMRNEKRLENQVQTLQAALEKLRTKEKALACWDQLKQNGLSVVCCRLPAMYTFSLYDEADIRAYVQDSSQSSILLDPIHPENTQYGIFQNLGKAAIWPADSEERYYLYGLLQVNTEQPERHNADEFLEYAYRHGLTVQTPCVFIGRYLITAHEEPENEEKKTDPSRLPERTLQNSGGERWDYYEAWLPLERSIPERKKDPDEPAAALNKKS